MEYSFDAVFNTFSDTISTPPTLDMDPPPDTQKDPEIKTKKSSKKKFTPQEDKIITEQVNLHGEKGWRHIAEHVPGRTARQIRERWVNYLSPNVSRAKWTREEDELLAKMVSEHGTQWSKIAASFKLRTDVMLKNRWSYLKKRLPIQKTEETHEEQPKQQQQQEILAPNSQPLQLFVQDEYQPANNQFDQVSEIWQANESFLEDNVASWDDTYILMD